MKKPCKKPTFCFNATNGDLLKSDPPRHCTFKIRMAKAMGETFYKEKGTLLFKIIIDEYKNFDSKDFSLNKVLKRKKTLNRHPGFLLNVGF